MRVVMIHALGESIPPVRMAFGEVFPEAEVINLLDEGLLIDFKDKLTPTLLRRMGTLVTYSAEHGADAIGLACSVYAPAVEILKHLVDVPLVSSYSPVMADAVALGPRVGCILERLLGKPDYLSLCSHLNLGGNLDCTLAATPGRTKGHPSA